MGDHWDEGPVVCIAHGAFVPCRRQGEHRTTDNPYWVKAVRDYQSTRRLSVDGSVGPDTWKALQSGL